MPDLDPQEYEALERAELLGNGGAIWRAARNYYRAALAAREEPQDPVNETCLCRHPPEGMIGWDRGMVNRDCPLHGHEALPERRDPQMEKVVEAMHPGGEQEAWNDWYPKSPPSKRNVHRHGFNAGQAAGLFEGEVAAREDTERRDPALAIVGGLLRVVRGKVSESDAATDIEAAERFLAGEETGRPKVER